MRYWFIKNKYKIKRQINFRNLIIILLIILSFLIGNTLGKAKRVDGITEDKNIIVDKEVTVKKVSKVVEIPKIQIEQNQTQNSKEEVFIGYNIPLSPDLQTYTYDLCGEYGLNYELVLGVMKLESNFDIKKVGKNEKSIDRGLMQINNIYEEWYADLAELKEYDVFNPYHNIKMGIAGLSYYKKYWEKKGLKDEKLTKAMLLSYNRGLEGAKKYIRKYGYNHAYTRIVLNNVQEIVFNK